MLKMRKILVPLLALWAVSPALASEAVEKRMAEVVPGLTPDAIEPAAVDGLFEVRYGTDLFYVSEDGRYLIQGSLIDLESRENLTERALRGVRAAMFAEIANDTLTVYRPEGPVRHTINVFTDPNCPFCRQFHDEVPIYLEAGVEVRYFMYPVLGRDSPDVMRNVWCSDSRTDAMDRAKSGQSVPTAQCATPADQHLSLGRELGINGTPATVTGDGQLISGYRPAVEMIQALRGQ